MREEHQERLIKNAEKMAEQQKADEPRKKYGFVAVSVGEGLDEILKYEIAEELGLLDRVMQDGWKSLTSKETGRIGGLITKKKRENEKNDKSITNVN